SASWPGGPVSRHACPTRRSSDLEERQDQEENSVHGVLRDDHHGAREHAQYREEIEEECRQAHFCAFRPVPLQPPRPELLSPMNFPTPRSSPSGSARALSPTGAINQDRKGPSAGPGCMASASEPALFSRSAVLGVERDVLGDRPLVAIAVVEQALLLVQQLLAGFRREVGRAWGRERA